MWVSDDCLSYSKVILLFWAFHSPAFLIAGCWSARCPRPIMMTHSVSGQCRSALLTECLSSCTLSCGRLWRGEEVSNFRFTKNACSMGFIDVTLLLSVSQHSKRILISIAVVTAFEVACWLIYSILINLSRFIVADPGLVDRTIDKKWKKNIWADRPPYHYTSCLFVNFGILVKTIVYYSIRWVLFPNEPERFLALSLLKSCCSARSIVVQFEPLSD